jgi:hypothetical protein
MSQNNPYNAPQANYGSGPPGEPSNALTEVNGPAISLMAIASISLVFCLIGFVVDLAVLATGNVDGGIQQGPIDGTTKFIIRLAWGLVLIATSGFVLYSSIKMKNLQSFQIAYSGSILAVIPCLGPCCILGIPFGIWAIVVLNKPHIRRAFRS